MAIVDRIRKLMQLSHSTNVHEAAQAAGLAQRLMLEHKIEMADLSLNSNEKRLPEEVTEEALEGGQGKSARAIRWRISLGSRIAKAFNCKTYFRSSTDFIGIMGCKSDVQTCQYLQQYFGLEIERLAEAAWKQLKADADAGTELPRPKMWKNSFRDGAVHAIGEKLDRERLKNQIRTGAKVKGVSTLIDELAEEVEAEDAQAAAAEANPAALVLVREAEEEREVVVEQKWREKFYRGGKSRLGRASWSYRPHSQDGYSAGISYGGQRGGIGGAKPRIEG